MPVASGHLGVDFREISHGLDFLLPEDAMSRERVKLGVFAAAAGEQTVKPK
jgi:hypothetical protein